MRERGIFILTAKTSEGQIIVLTRKLEREKLRRWRQSQLFYCQQCNTQVQLKVGDIKIPHFSHMKDASCSTLFSEGESQEHLRGKQQLYGFLQQYAKNVELEPFLKMLSQRPDILVTTPSESIPIEFQCSTIPIADIESRSDGYRSIGMNPIWILHTPAKFICEPVGVGVFYLSRFHESLLTFTSPEGLTLLTYNPQTELFHYFTSLICIAGKRYIGIHRTLPLSLQVFPFARPKAPSKNEIIQYTAIYSSLRTQFLQSRILLNRKGVNDSFLRMCYEMRILPADLPQWIGLPVPFNNEFREHDCEWQLAFLYHMRRKGINIMEITNGQVRRYIYQMDGSSDGQQKACFAYLEYLRSVGVDSSKKSTVINEEKVFDLFSERFLAKRREN